MSYEEYLNFVQNANSGISPQCPVCRTLELLNGKWRLIIIYELCKKESFRFGELKRSVPNIINYYLT